MISKNKIRTKRLRLFCLFYFSSVFTISEKSQNFQTEKERGREILCPYIFFARFLKTLGSVQPPIRAPLLNPRFEPDSVVPPRERVFIASGREREGRGISISVKTSDEIRSYLKSNEPSWGVEIEGEALNDEEQGGVMEMEILLGSAEKKRNVDMGLWVHAFHLRCHLTLHRSCCLSPRVVLSAINQTELTGTFF